VNFRDSDHDYDWVKIRDRDSDEKIQSRRTLIVKQEMSVTFEDCIFLEEAIIRCSYSEIEASASHLFF
jgi:hypothetical protein